MMDESKVGLTSKQKAGNFIGSFGLIIILLVIFGLFSFLIPGVYFTWVNLRDMIRFSSFVGIGAIGMTFCIMTGNFDISVGSMLALAGVLGASLAPRISGVGGVIVTIIVALFLGFINGVFVTKLKIPAFITTLGMLFVFRAIAYIYTNNTPQYIQDRFWISIGNKTFLGLPIPIYIMAVCYGIAYLLLKKSPVGRYIIAVGTNSRAATLSGINVDNIKILVFTLIGLFVGIAAVINASMLGAANPGMMGDGWEFQVITAVVLGGTALSGGSGSLGGSLLAALIIIFLKTGMSNAQVNSYWQQVATGLVLIFAVSLNKLKFWLIGQTQ
ncbi:MAG: ABC transporter permease [Actinobacteria bacterium]|nr:ABC transporter permease [Actinomycetota bacterium]MCG2789793.1 ABC transporter permease [Actinomycetes bacterium]